MNAPTDDAYSLVLRMYGDRPDAEMPITASAAVIAEPRSESVTLSNQPGVIDRGDNDARAGDDDRTGAASECADVCGETVTDESDRHIEIGPQSLQEHAPCNWRCLGARGANADAVESQEKPLEVRMKTCHRTEDGVAREIRAALVGRAG